MDTERRQQSGEQLNFSKTLFLTRMKAPWWATGIWLTHAGPHCALAGGRAVLSGDSLQLQPVPVVRLYPDAAARAPSMWR